eukprot:Awhi_evm1s12677
MEATCLYDFEAEAENELAFYQGDTVNVLDVSDANWFKAERMGRVGFVPSNRVNLRNN